MLLTTKIGTNQGLLDKLGEPVRTGQTGRVNRSDLSRQLCQTVNWTLPLHRSHQDDQNACIERSIWTPDEEVMPPGRPTPRSDRSDRSETPNPS